MAKPNTTLLVNITAYDGANSGNASGGIGEDLSNWVVVDRTVDYIGWCGAEQLDGDATTGVIYPVPIPTSDSKEAEKTFLFDSSEASLRQIPLAGTSLNSQNGGDNQYVFAMYFSGATASIPYLECWDDGTYTTTKNAYLNTDGESLIKAVCTTSAAPGSDTWAGTALQGVTSRIPLDTAVLTEAKNLYWNMRLVIPSTFTAQTYLLARCIVRFLYA